MRDWWIRSSGISVGVNVLCLHCTMTCTLMAFVCYIMNVLLHGGQCAVNMHTDMLANSDWCGVRH